MTAPVDREMRHLRNNRCPICDGAEGDPRGQSKRCTGYTNLDAGYAHCSREEFAGALDQNGAGLFGHRLTGPCKCGATHNPASGTFTATSDIEATYDYHGADGALLFQVVRKFGKRFAQPRFFAFADR